MGLFFVYILKVSLCLALFYLFYSVLLSRETFHRFNRIALLGILSVSLLLPFCEVTTTQQTQVHHTVLTIEQLLLLADTSAEGAAAGATQSLSLVGIQIALLVYLLGILFFACRNIYSVSRLLLLIKSGKRERLSSRCILVVHQKELAPFSWMRYIVISRADFEENGREILLHEMAHIGYRHSIDLLLADICIFFQWFNPAAWLLKQELQNIHEYQADESVINQGVDAKQYQLLLIKKAVGTRLYSMANSFNHSKLKKRITMMMKKKSNPWARLKYLYVLPLAAIAVTAFARPEVSTQVEELSSVKVTDLTAIVETNVTQKAIEQVKDTLKRTKAKATPPVGASNKVYDVVEEMPVFPGGTSALMDFVKQNLRYPAKAIQDQIEGRVIVQFIVKADGKVTDAAVIRSVREDLDNEAVRVVRSMPVWTPGKQRGKAVAVKYTMPIAYNLNSAESKPDIKVVGKKGNGSFVITSADVAQQALRGPSPLIFVDGEKVSNEALQAINPESIKGIEVLKDKSATDRYGEEGKNGVIKVTLFKPGEKK